MNIKHLIWAGLLFTFAARAQVPIANLPANTVPSNADIVVTQQQPSARQGDGSVKTTISQIDATPDTVSNKKITLLTVTSAAASRAFTTADLFTQVVRSNSGSAMTDSLPSAVTAGAGWNTTIVNSDTGAADTLTPAAGTIGGSAMYVLAAGQAVCLLSDGTNYQICSGGLLTGGTAGQYLAKNSSTSGDVGWTGPPVTATTSPTVTVDVASVAGEALLNASTNNVQVFSTAVSTTWTKPSSAANGQAPKKITVYCIGAGGGGGGGAFIASGTAMSAGAGGGGGNRRIGTFDATTIGSTESIAVGDGGTAGTAGTAGAGGPGGIGGNTNFGSWLTCYGGGGGQGGASAAGSGGGGGAGMQSAGNSGSAGSGGNGGQNGSGNGGSAAGPSGVSTPDPGAGGAGTASAGAGNTGGGAQQGGPGGASGGALASSPAGQSGGLGGRNNCSTGGTAGTTGTPAGGSGLLITGQYDCAGSGGGGGASSPTGTAGAGGAGVRGGGAGGGGSTNSGTAGAGGKGGIGYLVIVTEY